VRLAPSTHVPMLAADQAAVGWQRLWIAEPDVTLTDFGLSLETALFAYLLARQPARSPALRSAFVLFFGATSLAALTGGIVHGFCHDPHSTGRRVLWPATLGAIGLASLAAWTIGLRLIVAAPVASLLTAVAALEFVAYCIMVLRGRQQFSVAVINYLPATTFLLIVFARRFAHHREQPVLAGLAGIVLTGVAAGVQQRRIALHARYFNHNAFYHLLQAIALFLFFRSAHWLVEQEPASRP
jgi:hypothetical protein